MIPRLKSQTLDTDSTSKPVINTSQDLKTELTSQDLENVGNGLKDPETSDVQQRLIESSAVDLTVESLLGNARDLNEGSLDVDKCLLKSQVSIIKILS